MEIASAKAPGKILWIGGYSVLERPNVSLISTVNAYVHADVAVLPGNDVEFSVPQLGLTAKGQIDTSTGKLSVEVPKELSLLKTAAEVSCRYAVSNGAKTSGFRITTKNDDAFSYTLAGGKVSKSGLGSSAAVTVATVSAILNACGAFISSEDRADTVHKLAQTAHSIATGKVGSGFDIAAASYGSSIYSRYSPDIVKNLPHEYSNEELTALIKKKWDYSIERFRLPDEFKLLFANFTGESMITTAAIGSVSGFKAKEPEKYADLIKRINDENQKAVDAIKRFEAGDKDALGLFKEGFEEGRRLTKELGILSSVSIEPDDCTNLIEESKNNGAFLAKLPGAGGKDSIAALALSEAEKARLKNFWKGRGDIGVLDLNFSETGAV